MCWSAQPPQVPKCRQGGCTRSALGAMTRTNRRAAVAGLDLDRLAGQRERHEDARALDLGDAVAAVRRARRW